MVCPVEGDAAFQSQPTKSCGNACASGSSPCASAGTGCADGSASLPSCQREPVEPRLCQRCGAVARVAQRPNGALCGVCLQEQCLSRIRGALRGPGGLPPDAPACLAYGGDAPSALLLAALAQLRIPPGARAQKRRLPYDLHIVHVCPCEDEEFKKDSRGKADALSSRATALTPCASCLPGVSRAVQAVLELFPGSMAAPAPTLEVLRLPAAASAVLAATADPSARADLSHIFRWEVLRLSARRRGCARLLEASTATTLASRAVARASAGRGAGLGAGVRAIDGLRTPALLRPMRGLSAREAALAARFAGLETLWDHLSHERAERALAEAKRAAKKPSVGDVAANFVGALQSANAGGVQNVLSALGKLQAFPWNEPEWLEDARGASDAEAQADENFASFCLVCCDPLASRDVGDGRGTCAPCREHLLPACPDLVAAALPPARIERLRAEGGSFSAEEMRARCAEWLLEDGS